MKKKTAKKLVLARETVMNLCPQEMREVVGGKPPVTCSCEPECDTLPSNTCC